MTVPLGSRPSRLPTAALADAFAPPAARRSAALVGRLAPRPADDLSPSPLLDPPAAADSADDPLPAVAPARGQAPSPGGPILVPANGDGSALAPPQARAQDVDSPARAVIVYLPASLRDQLRAAGARSSRTYTDLVLEALDATHPRLGDLVAAATPGTARRPGSLFGDAPRTRRLRHEEPHVQVSLRLTTADVQVIDQLATTTRAPSRSALVTAALAAHLAQVPD